MHFPGLKSGKSAGAGEWGNKGNCMEHNSLEGHLRASEEFKMNNKFRNSPVVIGLIASLAACRPEGTACSIPQGDAAQSARIVASLDGTKLVT
jgi:hypothetical protein